MIIYLGLLSATLVLPMTIIHETVRKCNSPISTAMGVKMVSRWDKCINYL